MQDQDQDKALTALVRSMKRALARDHNIEVPHAALRASLLQAQGEHPHAFAAKTSTLAAAPSAQAQASNKARQPGSEPLDQPLAEENLARTDIRTLHLAEDDFGCIERLALDPDGRFLLPQDWQFDDSARLLQVYAEVPRVRRYGLPDYLADPAQFFDTRFSLKLADVCRCDYEDLGDDSDDSAWVRVRIADDEWHKLLDATLAASGAAVSVLAEWVGMHYGRYFDAEPKNHRAQWLERYLESQAEAMEQTPADRSGRYPRA